MLSQRCLLSFGILLSLLSQGDAACSMTKPCLEELGQGKQFAEPVQLRSNALAWNIDLDIDVHDVTYGWLTLKRRLYNGKIVGPTWNIKRKDNITVTVNNRLSPANNDNGKPFNTLNYPNTTNLHTHGLHISSNDPQDNVLLSIEPGATHQYTYQIHEKNPHGTYWYHPHVHQSTMIQVMSGMSGMIIVEDDENLMPTELAAVSCPHNCDKDLQMIFQSILQYSNNFHGFGSLQNRIKDYPPFTQDDITTEGNISLSTWLSQNLDYVTVNGILQPELYMNTGQIYRYRMVNAAGAATIEVFITEQGTNTPATSCDIREIALDGVYLDAPRSLHLGQSFLAPATRIDWLIKCNTPGMYELRSYRNPDTDLSIGEIDGFSGVLLTMSVAGFAAWPIQNFPTTLPPRPSLLKDLRCVPESDIKGRFVLEFGTAFHLNRDHFSSGSDYRYKMRVNETQEWHVVNTDNENSHPLHMHVNHFQVISYNKYTGGFSKGFADNYVLYNQDDNRPCYYQREAITTVTAQTVQAGALKYLGHDQRFIASGSNTLGYSTLGDWRDTMLIPPLSNITIRFTPERFTCDVIIHCHILSHEDLGMMINTLIVGSDESVDGARTKSGNAYPGTCRQCDRYPFNNKSLCDTVVLGHNFLID